MADRFRTVSMSVHRVFIVNMLLAFAFHLHSAFALPFSVHLPLTKLCSMFTDRSPCICLPSIQLFICSPFKWKSKKVPVMPFTSGAFQEDSYLLMCHHIWLFFYRNMDIFHIFSGHDYLAHNLWFVKEVKKNGWQV